VNPINLDQNKESPSLSFKAELKDDNVIQFDLTIFPAFYLAMLLDTS